MYFLKLISLNYIFRKHNCVDELYVDNNFVTLQKSHTINNPSETNPK